MSTRPAGSGGAAPGGEHACACRDFRTLIHPLPLAGARAAHAGARKLMPQEDDAWDAGDMGCGELVMALRMRLRAMPGGTLKLTATDPGAPADIPAWCRMTGHTLLRIQDHDYWIQARP